MPEAPEQPPCERDNPRPVLVLVRDLIFSSRITATARAANAPVKLLRSPAALAGAEGRLLIVDLNEPAAVEAAAAWKQQSSGDVVGFVSHVDVDTIARARAAGLDRVMPRSQFVNALADLLRPS